MFDCGLSEDARFAVSGSEDMTMRLWDLVQGRLLFTFAASSAVFESARTEMSERGANKMPHTSLKGAGWDRLCESLITKVTLGISYW